MRLGDSLPVEAAVLMPRQARFKAHFTRTLEARNAHAHEIDQLLRTNRLAWMQLTDRSHSFAPALIRHSNDNGPHDRRVGFQGLFHLRRVDIFAAALDECFLRRTPLEPEEAPLIDPTPITRVMPAVPGRMDRLGKALPVTAEYTGPAHQDVT